MRYFPILMSLKWAIFGFVVLFMWKNSIRHRRPSSCLQFHNSGCLWYFFTSLMSCDAEWSYVTHIAGFQKVGKAVLYDIYPRKVKLRVTGFDFKIFENIFVSHPRGFFSSGLYDKHKQVATYILRKNRQIQIKLCLMFKRVFTLFYHTLSTQYQYCYPGNPEYMYLHA